MHKIRRELKTGVERRALESMQRRLHDNIFTEDEDHFGHDDHFDHDDHFGHDAASHHDNHHDFPPYYPQLNAFKSKPAALLSIIGSYIVIREVLKDHRVGGRTSQLRSKVIPRFLLAISISDIFFSLPYFLSTWMVPSDIDNEIWGNVGNQATCTLQATIFQFGVTTGPLFNAFLAFFSLLMVRYNWNGSRLARAEKWIHATIWIFALVCAIFPLPLGLYNFAHDICWFAASPLDCKDSRYGDEANCHRGDKAWIYAITFHVFPSWTCLLASAIMMAMLYCHVRRLEDRAHRWTSVSAGVNAASAAAAASSAVVNSVAIAKAEKDRKKSKAVAERAILYVSAFLFTNIGDFITHTLLYAYGFENVWLDFVSFALFPLQGFLTFVIFARKRKMTTPEGRFVRRVVFDWLCCCICPKSPRKQTSSSTANSNTKEGPSGAEQRGPIDSGVSGVEEGAPVDVYASVAEQAGIGVLREDKSFA